jgi:hypothetical protein
LIALRDPQRGARYAVRWLQRWIEEKDPALGEVVLVAGCLNALGGPPHTTALATLRISAA